MRESNIGGGENKKNQKKPLNHIEYSYDFSYVFHYDKVVKSSPNSTNLES